MHINFTNTIYIYWYSNKTYKWVVLRCQCNLGSYGPNPYFQPVRKEAFSVFCLNFLYLFYFKLKPGIAVKCSRHVTYISCNKYLNSCHYFSVIKFQNQSIHFRPPVRLCCTLSTTDRKMILLIYCHEALYQQNLN